MSRSVGRVIERWCRMLAAWGTRITPAFDIFPYAFTRGNTDLSTGMRSIENPDF